LDQTHFDLIYPTLCFENWHVNSMLKLLEHFGFEILGASWFWNFNPKSWFWKFYYRIVLNVSRGSLNPIAQSIYFLNEGDSSNSCIVAYKEIEFGNNQFVHWFFSYHLPFWFPIPCCPLGLLWILALLNMLQVCVFWTGSTLSGQTWDLGVIGITMQCVDI
jgi:hypothetical protein